MQELHTILVANRGEIALRIMRTCRKLGLRTVAVFSDADEHAPHVRFADEAVRLGPAPAGESYLDISAVLRAASLTGAVAVHPGYGFLAENPDFAAACTKAGLTFIGPTEAAIRAMGLKREAKALVAARGVPTVKGSDGGDQTTATLRAKALEVGLPVIFKPSAGGGGKGMKIARTAAELDDAIESGRREAHSAFGDGTLIIEQYLERPRHLEVQLLADTHGNVVHLFERECSIQRRHQKLVEETPSTLLSPEQRAQMGQAAVEVAKAIGYTNAGTVEFIVDAKGQFFFSEMNTRLQVEHRVTELVTGLDLVEQQLRVARGERLGFTQSQLTQRGHAVEVRLCAEDPARDFVPCTGPVTALHVPEFEHLTVDCAVEAGGSVTPHYDSMIAKLIAWAPTRAESTALLARALDALTLQGVQTNRAFLARVLRHPAYQAGTLHTGFITEHAAALLNDPVDAASEHHALVAATMLGVTQRPQALEGVPRGWRNNRAVDQHVTFSRGEAQHRVEYRALGQDRFLLRALGTEAVWRFISFDAPVLTMQSDDGVRHRFWVSRDGDRHFVRARSSEVTLREVPRFPAPVDAAVKGGFISPMPGKVTRVLVSNGQRVSKGEKLLVLEAMKMEQTTVCPVDGVVKQVLVREGEQVTAGQVLVVLE